MKWIKRYSELFESKAGLTKKQIEFLDRYTKGKWTLNPSTGLVDVDGDFDCSRRRFSTLRGIRFGRVTGNFYCHENKLTSLEGAPDRVGGKFFLDTHTFKWTPEGKIKFIGEHPKYGELIIPTLPYEDLLKMVSEDPTLLETMEKADKNLCDKILKGLGWDKMGPDLLRQLKAGIF